jgi:hypothetical protein
MNMVYVASRFEVSRRREKLSFGHHAELASLPRPDQERWLERAQAEKLPVHVLRRELRHDGGSGSPASVSDGRSERRVAGHGRG